MIVVFLAIHFFLVKNFEEIVVSQFKDKSASQVELLTLKLGRDVRSFNYFEMNATVRALFAVDSDIVEVSIYEFTPANKLFHLRKYKTSLPMCNEELIEKPCLYSLTRRINSSIPIYLNVVYSTENVFYKVREIRANLVKIEILSFLVLLIAYFLGYFLLKRRTHQVIELLSEIREGKFKEREIPNDEFGYIESRIVSMYREIEKEKRIDDELLDLTSRLLKLIVSTEHEEAFIESLSRELKETLGVEVKVLKRAVVRLEECVFSVSLLNNKDVTLCFKGKLPDEIVNILVNIVDAAYMAFKERVEKENLFLQTISALANTIDATSPWTRGHSLRVSELAVEIGKAMGLGEEELEDLKVAGILHDIGKIGIPKEILDKRGRLTDEEYEIVKKHSLIGYEVLKPVKLLGRVLPAVLYHHERCDGSGYPEGLKCHEIPLFAKIVAVADVIEAMTAERPYKRSYSLDEVLSYLEENKGRLFDPQVVDAAVRVREKIGEILRKNNNVEF